MPEAAENNNNAGSGNFLTSQQSTLQQGLEQMIAVLHSKLSKGERYDQWMRMAAKQSGDKVPVLRCLRRLESRGRHLDENMNPYKSDMSPNTTPLVAIQRARRRGEWYPAFLTDIGFPCRKGEYEKILLKTLQ